jgi:hypothetical protein
MHTTGRRRRQHLNQPIGRSKEFCPITENLIRQNAERLCGDYRSNESQRNAFILFTSLQSTPLTIFLMPIAANVYPKTRICYTYQTN